MNPNQMPYDSILETVIRMYQDLSRCIDYLYARRDEFDVDRIGYYGVSYGGMLGPVWLGLEHRIRAAVLVDGGLVLTKLPRDYDPFNFAPRVQAPVLMLNGRYDVIFPPAEDRNRETPKWFDRHLGEVKKPTQ